MCLSVVDETAVADMATTNLNRFWLLFPFDLAFGSGRDNGRAKIIEKEDLPRRPGPCHVMS
jgi:hypothetical protein